MIARKSSNHRFAAGLAPQQTDCGERPVAFVSEELTETRQRWLAIGKEGHTVIFAFHTSESNRMSIPICIDCNRQKLICECSQKSARWTRWTRSLEKGAIVSAFFTRSNDDVRAVSLSRLITRDKCEETTRDVRTGGMRSSPSGTAVQPGFAADSWSVPW